MKTITLKNRITVALLAAVMMVSVLAGCQTKASVVKRPEGSSRGTVLHAEFQ
jgi:outer membrane protein assembly factor BamE (lipoprotein component of BamABCDE complex)